MSRQMRAAWAAPALVMMVLGGLVFFGAQPAGADDGPLEVTATLAPNQDLHDGQTVNVSYRVKNQSLVNPLYIYHHEWGWYSGPQVQYSYSNPARPYWDYNPQGITCSPPPNGYRLQANSSITISCTVHITGGGYSVIRPLFAVKGQRSPLGANCVTFWDSSAVDIHPVY